MLAVVQSILLNHRRAKDVEDDNFFQKGGPDTILDSDDGAVKRTSIANLEGVADEPLKFIKDRWVERLVLENAISSRVTRCFIFVIQFLMFFAMLMLSFPADSVLPVHQTLVNHFNLTESDDPSTTTPWVDNLEELKEYLQRMAFASRDFSPVSDKYVSDLFAKSYLAEEMEFWGKQYKIKGDDVLRLTKDFTVMVWVKTQLRFATILEKRNGDKTCWRVELEKLYYGEHEASYGLTVPNPLASTIGTNWQESAFKTALQDGKWHHFAVSVKGGSTGSVTYFNDGIAQDPVPLVRKRPITDCAIGNVYIGDAKPGTLVDLKFYPRVMGEVEMKDIIRGGKALDDLVAGNGALVTQTNPLSSLATDIGDVEEQMALDRTAITQHVDDAMTRFSVFISEEVSRVNALILDNVEHLVSIAPKGKKNSKRRRLKDKPESVGAQTPSSAQTSPRLGDEQVMGNSNSSTGRSERRFLTENDDAKSGKGNTNASTIQNRPTPSPDSVLRVGNHQNSTTDTTSAHYGNGGTNAATSSNTKRALSEQKCTDDANCFSDIVNRAIRKLAKLAPDADLDDVNSVIVDIELGVVGSVQPYGKCASFEDPENPDCQLETCYLDILRVDPLTFEQSVNPMFNHIAVSPDDTEWNFMEFTDGRGWISRAMLSYILLDNLNSASMRLCRGIFVDIILPILRCVVSIKNGKWVIPMMGDEYDMSHPMWGFLGMPYGYPDFEECAGNSVDWAAVVSTWLPFQIQHQMSDMIFDALYFIAHEWMFQTMTYAFKEESKLFCEVGTSTMRHCRKLCGWCAEHQIPTPGMLTSALSSCQDAADYTDWMGRDCSWYRNHDQPACAKYGSEETRSQCRLSCDNCDTVAMIMDTMEIDTGAFRGQRSWSLDEYGNFCTLTNGPRATLLTWQDIVSGLCLASADVDELFEGAPDLMQQSIMSGAVWLEGAKLMVWGVIDTFEACVMRNRHQISHDVVNDPRSPLRKIINAEVNTIRAAWSWVNFGGADEARPRAERYQENGVHEIPSSLTSERAVKRTSREESIYVVCGGHGDCAAWNVDNTTRLTWNCAPTNDIPDAELCTEYMASQRLFCARRCYTAGCGENADVLYNGVPRDEFQGYCQPCNGCTSETSIDHSCPAFCTTQMAASDGRILHHAENNRTLSAAQPRQLSCDASDCFTEENPNAAGSFALMVWIKDMDFQYIVKKTITLPPGAMFTNLPRRPPYQTEVEWNKLRGYDNNSRELTCWTWTVDEFCYREKWSDIVMKCKKNTKTDNLKDGEWHHYALVKRATEKIDYATLTEAPLLYSLTHTEELQFYIDGQVTEDSANRLEGWGMTDCAGPATIWYPISERRNDDFMGRGVPFGTLTVGIGSIHRLDREISKMLSAEGQLGASYVDNHLPLGKLLPLGGKNGAITGFRFRNVNIPKDAFIRRASLVLIAADLYANKKLEKIEQCTLGLDYVGRNWTLHIKVFGDRDPRTFSTSTSTFPDKSEGNNCCHFATVNTTKAFAEWDIDIESWHSDAVVPGSENGVSSNFLGGTKSIDVSTIVTEITTNRDWLWGGTLSLMAAQRDRPVGPDTQCNAETECSNLFVTPSGSMKIKFRNDVAANLGTGHCLSSNGNARYDGYWISAHSSPDCMNNLVKLKYKVEARGAEWFELGFRGDIVKQCRLLVDDGVNPITQWTDEWEIPWLLEDDDTAADPTTSGTGVGSVGTTDQLVDIAAAPTHCYRKEGESLCSSRDGTKQVDVDSCRCYHPQRKPTQQAPTCARGSYCYVSDTDEPKCLSHLHYVYREALRRGGRVDECEFLYKLAKPLENYPVWFVSYEGASQNVLHGKPPRLYVEWCHNADCVSPQFFNAGADALYGADSVGMDKFRAVLELKEKLSEGVTKSPPRVLRNERIKKKKVAPRRKMPHYAASPHPSSSHQSERIATNPHIGGHQIARNQIPVTSGFDLHGTSRRTLSNGASANTTYNAEVFSSSTHGARTSEDSQGPKPGQVFGLMVTSRYVATSELQEKYYATSEDFPGLSGPAEVISSDHHQANLVVRAYPNEVLSISPPIVFQQRSPLVSCAQQIPTLSSAMQAYFQAQTDNKCSNYGGYTCQFPQEEGTNFACVDRHKSIDTSVNANATWFGQETVSFNINGEMVGYPEFLDLMTMSRVFRGGEMRRVSDWLDLESSTIATISVFFAPRAGAGTVLFMKWHYNGPSTKMDFNYRFYSYVQMEDDVQKTWSFFNTFSIVLCIADLLLLGYTTWRNFFLRARWIRQVVARMPAARRQANIDIVLKNVILYKLWDVFDLVLRVVFIVFLVLHRNHYSGQDVRIDDLSDSGRFQQQMYEILKLPWSDQSSDYSDKMHTFVNIVLQLMNFFAYDDFLSTFGYFLILAGFIRIVVYMQIHPRMAVLYNTVVTAFDDILHFFLAFFLLFVVLAMQAVWSFGPVMPEFSNVENAMYTQFRMLFDDFPFDSIQRAPDRTLFLLYMFTFAFFVFFLLLNFFLAIVIDTYAAIKERVEYSKVERSFPLDIAVVFIYPFLAFFLRWPQREKLMDEILYEYMDLDDKNDEYQEDHFVVCTPQSLVHYKIVPKIDQARSLMRYYLRICPDLHVSATDPVPELEHELILKRLRQLDQLKHALKEHPQAGVPPIPDEVNVNNQAIFKMLSKLDKRVHDMNALIKQQQYREGGNGAVTIHSQNENCEAEDRKLSKRSLGVPQRARLVEIQGAQGLIVDRIAMHAEGARLLSEGLAKGRVKNAEDAEMELFMVDWHLKSQFLGAKGDPPVRYSGGGEIHARPMVVGGEKKDEFTAKMLSEESKEVPAPSSQLMVHWHLGSQLIADGSDFPALSVGGEIHESSLATDKEKNDEFIARILPGEDEVPPSTSEKRFRMPPALFSRSTSLGDMSASNVNKERDSRL